MRILITMIDGSSKKGTVEENTLVADLSTRIKIPADCCLTLAGVPLEGDRTLGEYGISNGMELEVERLGGAATTQRVERMQRDVEPKKEETLFQDGYRRQRCGWKTNWQIRRVY